MLPVTAIGTDSPQSTLEDTLREVVQTLAPIDRTPCSPGERAAADWLAARMERIAGVEVALEDVHFALPGARSGGQLWP